MLPAAALNYLHFGNPLGAHASAVLAPIGESFVAARWQRVQDWLWPASAGDAAGLCSWPPRGPPRAFGVNLRARQLLALTGGAAVAMLAARRALPVPSFWQGFPLALLALRAGSLWPAAVRRLAVGGARDGGGRGAHGHQRRRRAVGHAVSARRGPAAAAAGGARRHRRRR